MIVGHHLIWTIYGYWLPNDPRGSMSHEIKSAAIAELGELHYGRKRIQPAGKVLNAFRQWAAAALKYPQENEKAIILFGVVQAGKSISKIERKWNERSSISKTIQSRSDVQDSTGISYVLTTDGSLDRCEKQG